MTSAQLPHCAHSVESPMARPACSGHVTLWTTLKRKKCGLPCKWVGLSISAPSEDVDLYQLDLTSRNGSWTNVDAIFMNKKWIFDYLFQNQVLNQISIFKNQKSIFKMYTHCRNFCRIECSIIKTRCILFYMDLQLLTLCGCFVTAVYWLFQVSTTSGHRRWGTLC